MPALASAFRWNLETMARDPACIALQRLAVDADEHSRLPCGRPACSWAPRWNDPSPALQAGSGPVYPLALADTSTTEDT